MIAWSLMMVKKLSNSQAKLDWEKKHNAKLIPCESSSLGFFEPGDLFYYTGALVDPNSLYMRGEMFLRVESAIDYNKNCTPAQRTVRTVRSFSNPNIFVFIGNGKYVGFMDEDYVLLRFLSGNEIYQLSEKSALSELKNFFFKIKKNY